MRRLPQVKSEARIETFMPEDDREQQLMEFALLQESWEIMCAYPTNAFVHSRRSLEFICNAIAMRLHELGVMLSPTFRVTSAPKDSKSSDATANDP